MKNKVLVTIMLMTSLSNSGASTNYYVELKSESTINIHGLTNINSFDITYFVKNSPIVFTPLVNQIDNLYTISIADFQIPLQNFEAENPQMKQDFLDLVQEKQFPTMTVSVKNFYFVTSSNVNYDMKKGAAVVAITLGGITKNYNIDFTIKGKGKAFSIEGNQTLNIRDFNLEPPTKLFGLIKVKEKIEIYFNLNVLLVHLT